MQRLLLLIFLLKLTATFVCAQVPAPAPVEQKPIIESVDITGVPEERITRELRERLRELVGQRFDQLAVDEAAFEAQNQLRDRVDVIRQLPGSDADHIKLVFEFGNADARRERESNINSRYIIEDVELRGVDDSHISDDLRREMRDLIGSRMDEDAADRIRQRLSREFRSSRIVSRRVIRGLDRDHIRIIYEVRRAPLFEFRRLGNYVVGHSKQSFSFGIEAPIEHRNNRFTFGIVNDGDALLERFAGYRLAFENIRAGTDHLGFRIEYFNYHEKWKFATQSTVESSDIPGIYRERRGVEPTLTVAVDRRFRLNLGASVTELQIQHPDSRFQNANAAIAEVTYTDGWEDASDKRHRVTANYSVRSATHNLDSDFIYTRHLGSGQYRFTSRHNEVVLSAMAGTITGRAPLFERFSLGNTTTLRGWNKYDLAPAGGNRLAHASLEYRFTQLQLFYDVGSVWDRSSSHETSHAVGFGVHSRGDDGKWFITFGVPIRSGRIQPLNPVFLAGVRF